MNPTYYWIGFVLLTAVQLTAALHALLYKRDPRSSAGWVAISLMFPLLGPLLYFFFGINRVQSRAHKLDRKRRFRRHSQDSGRGVPAVVEPAGLDLPGQYLAMATVSEALASLPLVRNNSIEPLVNGDEAFPAMLGAIEEAQASVFLMTYIFNYDDTGRRFVDALAAAVERGVEVRVLVDGVGALYSLPRTIIRALRKRGIRTEKFHPPKVLPPSFALNLRNHRKILTVDRRIGFAGGINIAETYYPHAPSPPKRASDVHFRLTGPVVEQLQGAFLQDWAFSCGDMSTGPEPPANPARTASTGNAICRVVTDGPDLMTDKLSAMLENAMTASQNRIGIVTPYFVPNRQMISALRIAALRGVDVTIILPAKNNLPFVHWATRNMLWELLPAGVKVYYQPPPFAHTKLFAVDDNYSLIGSSNLDPRSLRLNFEIGIEIFDSELNGSIFRYMNGLIGQSRPVTYEEVESRSLPVRFRDSLAWLMSPYL